VRVFKTITLLPGSTSRLTRTWLVAILSLCTAATPAKACDQLAAGALFWVRLTATLSSYTAKPGMPVHGFLLKSPECDSVPILSAKVPVEGRVLSVHRVGLGLWHETAALEIAFTRFVPQRSTPIEINGRVRLIDNARETVRKGVIRGIRSTDTPQGRITSRLKDLPSFHLYPDPFLLGYKMLFPIFPEPEINLPPGTDMEVELTRTADLPDDLPAVSPIPAMNQSSELTVRLTALPTRTYTKKGKEADVVNVAFLGSRHDLEQAFQAAGWQQSEPVSTHAVVHGMYAFLAKTNFSTAPMSLQLLEGRKPDLTLEKALQTSEKRNHLRIWQVDSSDGTPLWIGAAVHETGATLSIRQKGFIHHVSEDLGEEQQALLRDLFVAGCVDAAGSVARPGMDHIVPNATGEFFRTDGSVEVIRLKPCTPDPAELTRANAPPFKAGSRAFRYARREILTVRSDLWRANCIYSAFDLTRMTVAAFRRNTSQRVIEERYESAAARPPQHLPQQ
jgi:LssY-like putative type I secretion system component LssY